MPSEKIQKNVPLQRTATTQTKSSSVSQDYGLSAKGSDHLQNNGYGTLVAGSMGMGPAFPVIQPKLTVGQPDDKYEQEADSIAKTVVNKINNPSNDAASKENVNAMPGPGRIMKMDAPDEISDGESDVESKIESSRGSGNALPDSVKAPMENAFGADFSNVKIHTDSNSDKLNKTIQAKAFTTGNDIFFKSGEFRPESKQGQELVAHELTHVRQQTGSSTKGKSQSAIQRSINTLAGPSQVIQRFDVEFDNDDVEQWIVYIQGAITEIKEYITTKDCSKIESPTCKGARVKLDKLKQKFGKSKLVTLKKKLDPKGDKKERIKAMEGMLEVLIPQIAEASNIKDNEAKKIQKIVIDPSRDLDQEILAEGWKDFEPVIGILGLNPGCILQNIKVLLSASTGESISSKFLKALFLTTKECYEIGLVNNLVDKGSFISHLKKLETNVEKGGYSGILAELQVMAQLLMEGHISPDNPVIMGEMRGRTLPFKGAGPEQDIDLQFEDKKGGTQYIEVKDRVSTLEKKMNSLIGAETLDGPNLTGHQYGNADSRQLTSLVQIVNDDKAKGKQSALTVACIDPYGWVRFMTSDHCLQLINYDVSMKIGSIMYSPQDLVLLRNFVELVLDKEYDPEWREKAKDEKLPIRTLDGPKGNRHESAWTFEEKQPFPPTPEEIKKRNM